jgi:serine/threonine protein kinase/tetratricopeptide (TPR) repeat protein
VAKCPNCSGENADTQRFCGECGTPISLDTIRTESYAESTKSAIDIVARLKPGTLFAGRYQVIEELGMGGMGRIYRVLDTTLDREIALKFIKPEIASDDRTVDLLKNELVLARDIVHKNVAQMFDYDEAGGVPYITMQYVRGENLKSLLRQVSRLFAGQAIPIACQLCEGLAEAHRRHIVHRDLKPQNVMIDEDGQAKILDFGLARLLGGEGKGPWEVYGGTPAYISPEQARRETVDGRSDIYSLGVLMYEMLTGTLPFKAKSAQELIGKHLTEPPAEPRKLNRGISAELSRVVMKCLEKDPAKRYQSAEEVRADLDCLRGTGPGPNPHAWPIWAKIAAAAALTTLAGLLAYISKRDPKPPFSRIAVLQDSDSSSEPRGTGFDREIQEAVMIRLSGFSGISVIPERTVDAVDTIGKSPSQIGRLLRADYLLELSFRFEGPRIHLKAALIDAGPGRQARAYEFAGPADDLSSVKDGFSRALATVLPVDIADDRRHKINKGISSDLDARLLYHEGMRLIEEAYPFSKYDDAVFQEAVAKYQKALDLDPDYALALWALGNAYEARYNNTAAAKRKAEDIEKMCGYYQAAFDKNPDSSEAKIGLGWAHFNKGEFSRAFDLIKGALESEPRNPIVNQDVGAFLRSIGLYERAIHYLSRAEDLDPDNLTATFLISMCLQDLGRFGKAAEKSEKVITRDRGDVRARYYHATQLILAGRLDKAEKEIAAARELNADYGALTIAEALLAAARGEKARALALKGEREVSHLQGTCLYLLLDMPDEAMANIEAGIEKGFEISREYLYPYAALAKNPFFRSLRGSARFKEILKRQKAHYLNDIKKFEDL